jgi:transcriptional regulator with XRE-family HTH domain
MARARTKRPNPIDAHVGSRMRMRRMMLGMSQQKLATAFGVSFQQVQKYEKGANRMGSSRLQHGASILRVPRPTGLSRRLAIWLHPMSTISSPLRTACGS